MYGKINRGNVGPNSPEQMMRVRDEAGHYVKNRQIYEDLRKAYLHNYINQQELLALRGQVKAGDADGAVKGLSRLLMLGGQ